jgi:hypothetical protein
VSFERDDPIAHLLVLFGTLSAFSEAAFGPESSCMLRAASERRFNTELEKVSR